MAEKGIFLDSWFGFKDSVFSSAFGVVISERKNVILNQIAKNESFGTAFLKNCDLKTQKSVYSNRRQ